MRPRFKGYVSLAGILLVAVLTSIPAIKALSGQSTTIFEGTSLVFGNIKFIIDALSAWFIILISFTFITGTIYGIGYMRRYQARSSNLTLHWLALFATYVSMTGIICVRNGMLFLVLWEIMALSVFVLVIFDYFKDDTMKAGLNMLVQSHISLVLLMLGFIYAGYKTGTNDFEAISIFSSTQPVVSVVVLFFLFFAGFAFKAGFVPFHTWLPYAHPAAPSHISGIMSGVIVKMGIYGILRVVSLLKADLLLISSIVIILSSLTSLYGIINAAVQRDFKRMLAYCTIENIGIIGFGTGLGILGLATSNRLLVFMGFGGALFHTLNHSLFKSLLFFSAGSVYSQTHIRDIEKLGGLAGKMPRTAFFFILGSIAISGIPPFSGFISEFLIFLGMFRGLETTGIGMMTIIILGVASLSITGGISLLTFTKNAGAIFLGRPRETLAHEPVEVDKIMLFPQFIIVAVMVLLAFTPGFTGAILLKVTAVFLPAGSPSMLLPDNGFIHMLTNISIASAAFLALAGLLIFVRSRFMSGAASDTQPTWGCGYSGTANRMQYTGKSFSKSFAKLMGYTLPEDKKYEHIEANEIFPAKRNYVSGYHDLIQRIVVNPINTIIFKFLNLFQFIQNGRIQTYVVYGIAFILIIFIMTVLNLIH